MQRVEHTDRVREEVCIDCGIHLESNVIETVMFECISGSERVQVAGAEGRDESMRGL